MGLVRYSSEAPVRAALVDPRGWMASLRWLPWFQLVATRIGAVSRLDATYDPPNLVPGAVQTVDVSFDGVSLGDYVTGVSFSPMTVGGAPTNGIRLLADVTAVNRVSVSFFNMSAGAIDLDAGTIRIQVEQAT